MYTLSILGSFHSPYIPILVYFPVSDCQADDPGTAEGRTSGAEVSCVAGPPFQVEVALAELRRPPERRGNVVAVDYALGGALDSPYPSLFEAGGMCFESAVRAHYVLRSSKPRVYICRRVFIRLEDAVYVLFERLPSP